MIGSYVGLEIGTARVAAVRLRRSIRGFVLRKTVCREVTAGGTGEPEAGESALTQCLMQLRSEGWGDNERVVVSVPESFICARLLELPFVDPRRLARVIPFELEDLLPVGLEKLVVGHQILSTGEGGASVLAMAIQNGVLERRLRILAVAGFEVSGVSVGSLALAAYYDGFLGDDGGPAVIINIQNDGGALMATLCAIEARRLHAVRTVLGNAVGSGSSLVSSIEGTVLTEIQRTIHVWRQSIKRPITRAYLCGMGVDLLGLRSLLGERLSIPDVEVLGVCALQGQSKEPALVVAAGLAVLAAARKKDGLDLGRGLDTRSRPTGTRRRWIYTSAGVFLVFILAMMSLWLHYRDQVFRYAEVNTAIRILFHESFPDLPPAPDEVGQARSMVAQLEKRLSRLGGNRPTVLQILGEITSRAPKETHMEVQELIIEAGQLQLEAEADSFESVDRIKEELARSPHFREVSVSDAKVGPAASRVRFRIKIVMGSA